MASPMSRGDRARQALLLGPGVGLLTVGLLSVFRDSTAASGWIVLALGIVLLLAYVRAALRRRPVSGKARRDVDKSGR